MSFALQFTKVPLGVPDIVDVIGNILAQPR